MYIMIIAMPLIGAAIAGLGGRRLGEKGAGIITSTIMIVTTIMAWTIWYEVGINNSPVYVKIWSWLSTTILQVNIGLYYDSVTAVMLLLIVTVSTLVHIYSTGYMAGDPHIPRFMSYLSLFTFFMIVLVTGENVIQLFIGWEGVGLCSYLLINFWYTRIQANKAAIQAMAVNRVGDIAIAIAMFIMYQTFGTMDYSTIFAIAPYLKGEVISIMGVSINTYTVIGLLILGGAAGKSAQVGLHVWLPNAMEGPTPVSALIHAATMVTAGVFLIIRCSPILEYAPTALTVIAIVGAITAFMAATIGVVQNDIKKVIAYSTCSQLGYMIFACGISNYTLSLFHLMNHGFFKALLFLSAGCVIHAMADEQDMRKLGGLIKSLPLTYTMMLIGSLSLMGFPFLTGFYSKDAILEAAYASYTFQGSFGHWLGTIAAFLTAFYSFRLIYLTFISEPKSPQTSYQGSHESPGAMTIPLVVLALGSIFIGWIFRDVIIGPGTPLYNDNGIFILGKNMNIFEAEFLPAGIKNIPVILSIMGATIALASYYMTPRALVAIKTSAVGKRIYTFVNNKWHFDYVYNTYLVLPLFKWGHNVSYKVLDRGLIEYLGPKGVIMIITWCTKQLSSWQSGLVYHYILIFFIFATIALATAGEIGNSMGQGEILVLIPFLILAGAVGSKA